MTAKIYRFPERYTRYFNGYKISLYNEEEVFITVVAMNAFGEVKEKITESTLENYDPILIIRALSEAKSSNLFTSKTKQLILKILKTVEPL